MTDWEQRLRNLAEGPKWELPALEQVRTSLEQLRTLIDRVASETGFTGQTDVAAADDLESAKSDVQALIQYLESDLPNAVETANGRREEAQAALASLGAGGLSPEQTQTIRTAAAGATVVFGGFSVVAGEGAIAAANWFMGSQREEEAQKAVKVISDSLDDDGRALPKPPPMKLSGDVPGDQTQPPTPGPQVTNPGGGRGPSYEQYPDFDVPAGPTGGVMPDYQGGVIETDIGPNGTPTPPVFPNPQTPVFVTPECPIYITPTPDGPILSGTPGVGTLPGGGGGFGTGGSGSGGLGGGGLSSGLIAGAGGAAALGGLGRAAASGGLGRLGGGAGGLGGRLGGGAGGLGGAGGAGGLGGRGGGLSGGLTANAGG
ncbi:MAG: hypothetical protein K0R60_1712, partial [Microbacterium sp.]|nr:hypothetical protein [Microbacterium sp.]